MAKGVSKNARKGSNTHTNICKCGGTIETKTIMKSGKIRHFAICKKCKKMARYPKMLK